MPREYSEKQCRTCGKVFKPTHGGLKYCSKWCREHPPINKKCKVCDKPLHKPQTKYCSQKCKASLEIKHRYICKLCGKVFHVKRREKQVYCSRSCYLNDRVSVLSQHSKRHKSVWQFGESDARHRRRAKDFGVEIERIKPKDIYLRDGWVCGICGKRVNPNTRHPHPDSATLDHIIPLSKGGGHIKINVRLAHLSCNVNRQTGGTDQLLLFG